VDGMSRNDDISVLIDTLAAIDCNVTLIEEKMPSLRDYFAAAALPCALHIAIKANDSGEFNALDVNMSTLIAMSAYNVADAMLKARGDA
jgi:hypothetical protein